MAWHSRIARLTPRRAVLALLAALLMLIMRALFTVSFELACRAFALGPKERPFEESSDTVLHADIAWAVAFASRRARGSRCLDRALVAKLLLGAFRRNCLLRVGVIAGPSGALLGHAWVETAAGVVVGDDPAGLSKYKTLPQTLTLEQQLGFFLAMQRNYRSSKCDLAG